MGRYGLLTRLAMTVIGTIWLIAGGGWLVALIQRVNAASGSVDDALDENRVWFTIAEALVVGGFVLVKTGVTPDRPVSFEDEVPDAHPDLDPWDND